MAGITLWHSHPPIHTGFCFPLREKNQENCVILVLLHSLGPRCSLLPAPRKAKSLKDWEGEEVVVVVYCSGLASRFACSCGNRGQLGSRTVSNLVLMLLPFPHPNLGSTNLFWSFSVSNRILIFLGCSVKFLHYRREGIVTRSAPI